jgi:pyruvate formate lyase activating enzyme
MPRTIAEPAMHAARWWERDADGRVHCYLCPRHCRLRDGQSGYCLVRANRAGALRSLVYGSPAAIQVDPIEKKPLHHVLPGTRVLSLGTVGCNLGCAFCQNWSLARGRPSGTPGAFVGPDEVVALARRHGCPSVAFTYNEPTVWAEYADDIARAARAAGLLTVMVTNGYVTPEAFGGVFEHLDAVNVDLKAITDGFYRRVTLARLDPVLDTLVRLRRDTAAWLEVTHLMIPGLNDDPDHTRRLAGWMADSLGPDVPLHLSAFHPDHRMRDRPPTPPSTLRAASAIARAAGLRHVYEGNVLGEGGHTRCATCGATLIERYGFEVRANRLRDGRCPECATAVPGVWRSPASPRPPREARP